MNKKLLGLVWLLLTSILGLCQTSVYVKSNTLNLRDKASKEAEILMTLNKGQELSLIEEEGDWSLVEIAGIQGYVFSSYLSNSPVSASTVKKREAAVLICGSRSAYAYHSHECHGLARCRSGVSEVSVSEARQMGYVACKICY